MRPTQGLLSRKIASLKTVWDDFENVHEALFAQVSEDKEATELTVLDVQLKIYEDALDRDMEFEGTYGEPVSAPPTLEIKVADLLQQRTGSYARAEEMVDGILGVLLDTEIPLTQASLRSHLLMLEEVKQEGSCSADHRCDFACS